MLTLLRNAAFNVAELFYPSRCSVCESLCNPPAPFCEKCDRDIAAMEADAACARCALPLAMHNAPCPWCLGKGRYPFSQIARLSIYDEPMKSLIHDMKYHRRWPMAELLAERLLRREHVQQILACADGILPVPLHFRRQFSRGYNQSHVLAKRLAKASGKPLIRGVIRIRNTKTQTEIRSQRDRQENMRGAFTLVNSRAIENKNLVIVDDVMTSGATLQAVGRALVPANPASLSAIVIAVADPKHRHFEMI